MTAYEIPAADADLWHAGVNYCASAEPRHAAILAARARASEKAARRRQRERASVILCGFSVPNMTAAEREMVAIARRSRGYT